MRPEYNTMRSPRPRSRPRRLSRSAKRRGYRSIRVPAGLAARLLGWIAALWSGVCHAQSDEPLYAEAMARASAADRRGDLLAETHELAGLLGRYPQDFDLTLRLGFAYFRAGMFTHSEDAYRKALAQNGDPAEASLGLGWALQRQGRCAESSAAFRVVLGRRPADAGARDGLRLCAPPRPQSIRLTVGATLGGQASNQVGQGTQISANGAARLDVLFRERLLLGALYRYRGELPAISITFGSPFAGQHEVYLHAGYGVPFVGATLHYAVVRDQGGLSTTSNHIGMGARISPLGHIFLDLAASFYSDATVFRVGPSWWVPLRFGLSLQPGLALQVAQGQVYFNYAFVAAFSRGRFSLWAGGKYGEEFRPAYLDATIIYNLSDKVLAGALGGASIKLGKWGGPGKPGKSLLSLYYTYDCLRPSDGTADTNLHALTIGISRDF